MPDDTLNPGNLPMVMRRGVTFGPIILNLKTSGGLAVNLTGYTVRWIARPEVPSPNEYDLEATINLPATDGQVQSEFTDEETLSLFPAGSYRHALTLTNSGGDVFGPFVEGPLTVEDQAARP